MNPKRIRLAAMLAASAMLLGGCAQLPQERAALDMTEYTIAAPVPPPDEDGFEESTEQVLLSFLSTDGTRLVPTPATITVPGGKSRAEAALDALMAGGTDRNTYWPDIGDAYTMEVSGEIAMVDLPSRARALSQEELFAVRMAIADTLTGFSEIAYVNVLVGGREEGFDLAATFPVGTMTRPRSTDIAAQYGSMDERRTGGGFSSLVTLYFPTEDGRLLIPEVRSVNFGRVAAIETLYVVLEELGKGSSGRVACAELPAPMEYIEEMPEIVRPGDGANRVVEIRFQKNLDDALEQAGLTRGIYLAMLTDTLMGIVPGIEGVRMSVGGETITALSAGEMPDGQALDFAQTQATRGDFGAYVGARVLLYGRDEESGKLRPVESALMQREQRLPRERLTALLSMEESALPDGLEKDDILAAAVVGDAVAVDLSARFGQALAAMDAQEQRLAVYAMVNTLTEGLAQQKVVFFFGGQQMGTLSGGLDMRGAFVRNRALVEEE